MTTWDDRPEHLTGEKLNAWALTTVSDGLRDVARALYALGNGDAGTTMGAVEGLAMKIHEGLGDVVCAIEGLTGAAESPGSPDEPA